MIAENAALVRQLEEAKANIQTIEQAGGAQQVPAPGGAHQAETGTDQPQLIVLTEQR